MTPDRPDEEPPVPDGGSTADAGAGSEAGAGTGTGTGSGTDERAGVGTDAETEADAAAAGSEEDDGQGRLSAAAARRYLAYGALVGLSLLAAVAVVGFYTSANAAINEWVVREFRPPFRALLNLAVLLFALAGISRLLDRLRD